MKILLVVVCASLVLRETNAKSVRGLLDTLTSMTDGTKVGTAMKVVDAFNKIGQFMNDLKTISPDAHQQLLGSINDIKSSMSDVMSDMAGQMETKTTTAPKSVRGLLDTLTSMTDGTKVGTAMKVVDAFNKIGQFMNDLKTISPDAHQQLLGSINDIKSSMSDVMSDMAGQMETKTTTAPKSVRGLLDTLTSMTDGTKVGTAMKVVDAFNKIGQFMNDLKTISPDAHQQLLGSINDIKSSMSDVMSDMAGQMETKTTTAPH